jgi:hypothetical protein
MLGGDIHTTTIAVYRAGPLVGKAPTRSVPAKKGGTAVISTRLGASAFLAETSEACFQELQPR